MLSRKYFIAGIKISKLFNSNLTAKYIKGDKNQRVHLQAKESKLESNFFFTPRKYKDAIVCYSLPVTKA